MSTFIQKVQGFSLSAIEQKAQTILNKFWGKQHLPLPIFKIVDAPNEKWLGRTSYNSANPDTTTIELQKKVLGDEKTLERVLSHELIHHVDFLKNPLDPTKKSPKDPHGKFFEDEEKKLNSRLGRDFVTKVSDQSFVENAESKEFEVLLYQSHGKIGVQTLHHPEEQKKALHNHPEKSHMRIVKTRDARLHKAPEFGKDAGFLVFKDQKFQDYLKKLFQGGSHPV